MTAKLSEMSLAAIVAGAALIGGVLSSVADAWFIDAGEERQTDIQLVQLAIGILGKPIEANNMSVALVAQQSLPSDLNAPVTADHALRSWAVDTINEVAEVKFDENAKYLLIRGDISFPIISLRQHVENPGQVPLKTPLANLGFGGVINDVAPIVDQ